MSLVPIQSKIWCWLAAIWLTMGIVLLTPRPALTVPVKDIPNPKKTYNTWIVDKADVLSADTETMLNQKISKLKTVKRSDIVVVTVDDTRPSTSPEDFTRELFNSWNIGFPHMKNSVLLVVSKYENYAAIEVGERLKRKVHPVVIKKILVNHIYISLEDNNLEQGLVHGIEDLIAILNPPHSSWSIFKHLPGILLFAGLVLLMAVPFVTYFRHWKSLQ